MDARLLWVGSGGFLGAIARYAVSGWVYRWVGESVLPYGTIAVNLAGCLLIGFLMGLTEEYGLFSPQARLFLLVGFLGSFTTFSTFGYETFALFRTYTLTYGLLNIGVHLAGGLVGVWLGLMIAGLLR